ncbi:chromosome segregation protein [Rosistilla ulvae]|uniref:Chromosome segregation protein n=1 Tax=Rosistilla ulvae TaxID=1930277 RepID=A0A517M1E2_9BACT|nr:DNA sulfur modification protein DndD [Rosistilla ulvae]QDS88695.1 chromosome segregation protein [Rosistilla ulvae]
MRIHTLRLNNFGLFRGVTEFDLLPKVKYNKERPVILVGGKNGAGKTTILEAVRLCLYGPLLLGSRVSAREYEEYLRSRVHRNDDALVMNTTASVALEFEHSELGKSHRYTVERSWDIGTKKIKTHLLVQRDGDPIDDLDHAHADDFLRDLIPPGVSQLYFFDGEKIQELAESDDDDAALSDAIRSLLGLDLVERLSGDLQIYANRLQKLDNIDTLQKELDNVEKEIQDKQDRHLKSRIALDEAQSRVDDIAKQIAATEARIAKEGGAFADVRGKLESDRKRLRTAIEDAENQLRQLAEGLLPFSLAKSLCRDLTNQLKNEDRVQGWRSHRTLLQERIERLHIATRKELAGIDGLTDETRGVLADRITQMVGKLGEPPEGLPDVKLVHRLSSDLKESLFEGIRGATEYVPDRAKKVIGQLETDTRDLQKTEAALKKAPKEDQLRPLVERVNDLNREIGGADADLKRALAEYSSAEFSLKEERSRKAKLTDKKSEAEKQGEREQMVESVNAALEEYVRELTADKSRELAQCVRRRFQQLWRKGDIVRRIEIDPISFIVKLYDRHDRVVPKTQLSAGEKQMYAISMLWGLAEVSRRPLPMVIDTPLGRLDGEHRSHLVEHYFPEASHQVIILSTDTEIDETYFNDLKPHLSHVYHLSYEQSQGRTVVSEGYFWNHRNQELTNAS